MFLPLADQSKNEEIHMEITNNAEFQIGVFKIDDAQLMGGWSNLRTPSTYLLRLKRSPSL